MGKEGTRMPERGLQSHMRRGIGGLFKYHVGVEPPSQRPTWEFDSQTNVPRGSCPPGEADSHERAPLPRGMRVRASNSQVGCSPRSRHQ